MCGSIKTGVHCCPRWVAPIKRPPELRANQGVEYVRCHDIIAARLLLDSRVVHSPMAYTPFFVLLSSLKALFFKSLKNELHFSDTRGA